MSEQPVREDVHALMGAYVLDALDDDERRAYERHLTTCLDCQAQVPGMRAAAARLGATAYVQPPAQLRATVLDDVQRTRQLPPVLGLSAGRGSRRARFGTSVLSLAAVLVLVVAGGLALTAGLEHRRADRQSAEVAALVELLDNPDHSTSLPMAGGGSVVLATAGTHALIEMRGAADPTAGRTYELWVLPTSGKPRPAGLLPTGDGRKYVADVTGAMALAVTLEPAGGSAQPTTDPLVTLTV